MTEQTADCCQRRRWAPLLAVTVLAAGIVLSQQGCTPTVDRSGKSMVPTVSATAATPIPSESTVVVTAEPSPVVTQAAMVTSAAQVTPGPDRWSVDNGISYASLILPNSDPGIQNILQLCEKLDGVVIKPGKTMRFWDSVGKEARKNLNTMTLVGDGGVLQSAAGVNMVSTVIYQAAACAGLTVAERHTSSIPPSFTAAGQDACVDDTQSKDLKITNPYAQPVTLRLHADNFAQGLLECAFAGDVPQKTAQITLESAVTGELAAPDTMTYVANPAIPKGRASVVPPHAGHVVRTDRIFTAASGKKTVEAFTTDTYPAEGTIIYYNPKDKPDVSKLNTEGPIEDYFGETAWEDVDPKIQKSLKEIYTDEQLAMLFAPRKYVTLPDVIGLPEAQAVAKLASVGVVGRVSYQDSGTPGVADGACFGMDVEPGQRWHTDANIALFVQRREGTAFHMPGRFRFKAPFLLLPAPESAGSEGQEAAASTQAEYSVVTVQGIWVQVRSEQNVGWLPDWYMAYQNEVETLQTPQVWLISAFDPVPLRLAPSDLSVYQDGLALQQGQAVRVIRQWEDWYCVQFVHYDAMNAGERWILKSDTKQYDKALCREGFIRAGATLYEGDAFGEGWTTASGDQSNGNPVRIVDVQDTLCAVEGPGGFRAVIRRQDFIPNPFGQ